jgi:hypothetical protein
MQALDEMVSGIRKQVEPAQIDSKSLVRCIEACSECVTICSMCADACTSEAEVAALRRCIRLCLDTVDLCSVTVRLLSRSGEADMGAVRATLEACETICVSTSNECKKHAAQHDYCGVCAEACAVCARACQDALETLFEGPSA